MQTLHRAEVKKKLYRVWYKLNEKTTIEVMTGAGLTAQGLAGPVYGSDKFKARAEHEVSEAPVMLGNIVMTEKKSEKYLGDILCSEGLRASVEASIKERAGKVKGSIYELRALTEDFRMQVVGGMRAAIDIYESCIVSSLLSNCGTWTEINKKEIKLLDEHQDTFVRALLQLPLSTPKAGPDLQRVSA